MNGTIPGNNLFCSHCSKSCHSERQQRTGQVRMTSVTHHSTEENICLLLMAGPQTLSPSTLALSQQPTCGILLKKTFGRRLSSSRKRVPRTVAFLHPRCTKFHRRRLRSYVRACLSSMCVPAIRLSRAVLPDVVPALVGVIELIKCKIKIRFNAIDRVRTSHCLGSERSSLPGRSAWIA